VASLCRIGRIHSVASSKAQKGIVLAQKQRAGRALPVHAPVDVTIGSGSKAKT
jgi:beta-lactam-binding protein with PASTA domain